MKKFISLLIAAVLTMGLLTSCGNNTKPAESSQTPQSSQDSRVEEPAEAPVAESQTISMAHIQGEWCWPMLDDIVADYKAQTGNTVELMYVPADSMLDWVTTQFVGGTPTDIIWSTAMTVGDYYKNGWTIDIAEEFNKPSAYTGQIWKDSFYSGVLDGVLDPNGSSAMLGMPVSISTVNLYYNADILAEVGVDGSTLQSWTDILNACKTIQESDKDYIPFSVQNSIRWNLGWLESFAMNNLWYDVVDTLDIIEPNGLLNLPEQILGVKTGVIDLADARMVDYFRFMKEFAQYFNNGFNAASWEFEALFNEGKSAMTINGSWYPNQVLQNELTVNYGTGPVPYIDAAISPASENRLRLYSTGRGGIDMFISQKAVDDGHRETCIDFLQYLSDPGTGAKLFTEKFMSIPVVQGVVVPKEMEGLTKYIGEDQQVVGWLLNAPTPESGDKFNVMFADFLVNNTTPEAFAQEYKKLMVEACDEAIAEHPEWNMDAYIAQIQG